jgi:hypothetical protein
MFSRSLFALAALAISAAAPASDGVLQINTTCVSFGCFAGDSSGFPVTITQAGSYQLTSNLTTASIDQNLIVVSADDVSIDLNGFAIRGPVTCTGDTAVCSGQSSAVSNGQGIRAVGVERLTVHNGRIVGVGGTGIALDISSGTAALYDLTLAENGRAGITIQRGLIHDVTSELNGGDGISTLFGNVLVRDSVVRGNGNFGLGLGGYCSGIVSTGNSAGTNCIGNLGPNQCETPTNCD